MISPEMTENPPPVPQVSKRFWWLTAGGVALVGVGLAILIYQHPSENPHIPACPMYKMTGLYCPGCGSTRATHYLLNGQLALAFRHNPLLLVSLPVIGVLLARWFYTYYYRKEVTLPFQSAIYRGILVVFVAFFVLRNIPWEGFDCLRPPARAAVEHEQQPF